MEGQWETVEVVGLPAKCREQCTVRTERREWMRRQEQMPTLLDTFTSLGGLTLLAELLQEQLSLPKEIKAPMLPAALLPALMSLHRSLIPLPPHSLITMVLCLRLPDYCKCLLKYGGRLSALVLRMLFGVLYGGAANLASLLETWNNAPTLDVSGVAAPSTASKPADLWGGLQSVVYGVTGTQSSPLPPTNQCSTVSLLPFQILSNMLANTTLQSAAGQQARLHCIESGVTQCILGSLLLLTHFERPYAARYELLQRPAPKEAAILDLSQENLLDIFYFELLKASSHFGNPATQHLQPSGPARMSGAQVTFPSGISLLSQQLQLAQTGFQALLPAQPAQLLPAGAVIINASIPMSAAGSTGMMDPVAPFNPNTSILSYCHLHAPF